MPQTRHNTLKIHVIFLNLYLLIFITFFIYANISYFSSCNQNTLTQSNRNKELKRYLEIYKNLHDISSLLSNLKAYTDSLNKSAKLNIVKDTLISDINIISTRFEMISQSDLLIR